MTLYGFLRVALLQTTSSRKLAWSLASVTWRRRPATRQNRQPLTRSSSPRPEFPLKWCPETESNRHGAFAPRDFKSRASASFAIRAFSKPFYLNRILDSLQSLLAGVL